MSVRWLVDGTNVVGTRPDGWWRDRPAAFARLVARLQHLAEAGDEVTVVFDGRPASSVPLEAGSVSVRWARRGGPDAADDRIVELAEADPAPATLTVVTSDRDLAARAHALGATTVGAQALLRALDELDADAGAAADRPAG